MAQRWRRQSLFLLLVAGCVVVVFVVVAVVATLGLYAGESELQPAERPDGIVHDPLSSVDTIPNPTSEGREREVQERLEKHPPTPDPLAKYLKAIEMLTASREARGREIFTGSGGCAACHTIDGIAAGRIGPDLTHIGTNAISRKPEITARSYIIESIRYPEAFVARGVDRATGGIMTKGITAGLSDQEVDALVEFLLAQK